MFGKPAGPRSDVQMAFVFLDQFLQHHFYTKVCKGPSIAANISTTVYAVPRLRLIEDLYLECLRLP